MEHTLSHHGIKGMKWGVRRYRNKDGSLTPAGRKRAGASDNDNVSRAKSAKNVSESGKKMTDALRKMNNDSIRRSKPKPMDLSKMSDKEMRDRINRALLEKQYNDIFNPPTVSEGRKRVDRILETAGDVLTVAGSALTIALAIQKLRGDG